MYYQLIIFFVIALIFLLITKYYLLQNQKCKENYKQQIDYFTEETTLTSTQKLKKKYNIEILYLSSSDAQALFKKSSQYLQNMNQSNLSARNCETLSDLYDKYMGGLQDITDTDKVQVDTFLLTTLDTLAPHNYSLCRYLAYWLRHISFAKGQEWLESGMPHTLGNTIIMDPNWFITPRTTTLFHELIHIHQRTKFFDFEDLYFLLGYFYHPKVIKGMEQYYQLNRNNPDGASLFWLWHYPDSTIGNASQITRENTERNLVPSKASGIIPNDTNNGDCWWIGAVFKSAVPVSVSDVNYIALQLTRTADGTYYLLQNTPVRLDKFKQYNDYMGINNNNYHPNETTAKYMEWYYTDAMDKHGVPEHLKYDGYKAFKKYMDDYLATYFNSNTE